MDRKAILVLGLCFVLLMLWSPLVDKWFPPTPIPPEASSAGSTGAVSSLTSTGAPAEAITPSITAGSPAIDPAATTLLPAPVESERGPEQTEVLETDLVRYVFTSHGGGIKEVELLEYDEVVGRQARRQEGDVANAALNRGAALPIFAINGSEALPAQGEYTLSRIGGGLRAEAVLSSGLRITKEYRPETNYLLKAAVRIENVSTQALRLPPQEWVLGTATPIDAHDKGQMIQMQWFDGQDDHKIGDPWFANRTLGCFPGTPRSIYMAGSSNAVWASAQNRFFALIAMPPSNAPAPEVLAYKLALPRPSMEAMRADRRLVPEPFGIQTSFRYPAVVLEPGQDVERWFDLFSGPKEFRTLDRLGSAFGNEVDRVMGFGWFGFFAKGLLLSMNGLHGLGLSYGLAIVVITLIIKLLFWPLTRASTRSMKRMQKLQPEMKALQAKYKDDPKKMNERMMAFMKEHRINPAAGCLPIMIQIPVFIGFFQMLRSAIELRGAQFLWALDLSQPDTIFEIGGFPVNPLPILMGLSQFWQMRLTPASPGMDPVQQKIFQFMPLMFLFILYNFSSGLTLYWTVQNLLTIVQTKLTKSTEEPEKPAPVQKGKTKQLPRPGKPKARPKRN
jgi:YidC/Oxa1 family membrane protein insertase